MQFYADAKFGDVISALESRGYKMVEADDPRVDIRLERSLRGCVGCVLNHSPPSSLFQCMRMASYDIEMLRWRNLSALVQEKYFLWAKPTSIVNHFEGAQNLSNKGKLAHLLLENDVGWGASFLPRSHALVPAAGAKPSEALVAASLGALLRDVAVQLAVGTLRTIVGPSAQVFDEIEPGVDELCTASLDTDLLQVCVDVVGRWADQLEGLASAHQKGGGREDSRPKSSRAGAADARARGRLLRRRGPGATVLALGGAEWQALVGPGGTVESLVAAARRGGRSGHAATAAAPPLTESSAAAKRLVGVASAVLRRLRAVDTHFGLGGGGVWIVKPAGLSCGEGITVVKSLAAVARAVAALNHKAVVQKYIERPLLVRGRKFDIRLWVLLTAAGPAPGPLAVWGFSDCYLRLSSRAFGLTDLDDRLTHLCNYSVQQTSDGGSDVGAIAGGGSGGGSADGSAEGPATTGNMCPARRFAEWADGSLGAGTWAGLEQSMRSLVRARQLQGTAVGARVKPLARERQQQRQPLRLSNIDFRATLGVRVLPTRSYTQSKLPAAPSAAAPSASSGSAST